MRISPRRCGRIAEFLASEAVWACRLRRACSDSARVSARRVRAIRHRVRRLHVGQFIQIDSQPVHRRSHLATRGLLSPSPRFCCPDSELLRRCHDTTPEVDDYRAGITLIAKRHGVNAAMPWRTGTGRQLFACQPQQWTSVGELLVWTSAGGLPQAGAVSAWFEHEPVRKRADQFAGRGTTRRRRLVHRARSIDTQDRQLPMRRPDSEWLQCP
jgi:hypothetical protein